MGMDVMAQLADLGVERLVIPVQALGGGNPIEAIDKLGNEVIAKL
jgi:hypothetical protein